MPVWNRKSECMGILIYYTSRTAGLWPRSCHCPRDGCPGSALPQVSPTSRDPWLKLNNLTDGEEAKDTWCHHSESHGCLANSGARMCFECNRGECFKIQIKEALICIMMCHQPGINTEQEEVISSYTTWSYADFIRFCFDLCAFIVWMEFLKTSPEQYTVHIFKWREIPLRKTVNFPLQ